MITPAEFTRMPTVQYTAHHIDRFKNINGVKVSPCKIPNPYPQGAQRVHLICQHDLMVNKELTDAKSTSGTRVTILIRLSLGDGELSTF